MQNISNLRAFLTFQHKHFSNSPSLFLRALSSGFWAITCLQWTMQQLQVPLSLLLLCLTLLLLLLLLSHHLSTIFLPSPAFSLSPVSLSGLQGTFGDSTGQPVTHLESVIILNVCRTFLFKYVQLFSVIDSALLKFCSIKHMLNL